jgi:UDP-N-acetylglucosamine--N-acetylmuramyl-(pentapeptide) pyrophosphoryl-undecaprenol N-acetylglucosamine transferase
MSHLLIMAAGTGGHIFPGLAIADTMRARGWKISWLGTTHGMEADIVPRHGVDFDAINFSGLRGKGLLHSAMGVFKLMNSFVRCFAIMRRRKPDVVLGMGGYVTVPGGLMAKLCGVPLALVNADAALLMSNKALLPFAKKILFGFGTKNSELDTRIQVTGNPVRREISALPAPKARYAEHTGPLTILVLGGSLGAQILNQTIPAALALIASGERPHVVHQSGRQHIAALQQAYQQEGVQAELVDFIDDMATRYAQADLVICRAGAITVSELCAAGVASILVPFIASTTSHQRDNAEWMAQIGAAFHQPQKELNIEALASLIKTITRERCLQMAEAAYANGKREANESIAQIIEKLGSQ